MTKVLQVVQTLSRSELARRIDHAVLKPWATRAEAEKALEEVERLGLRCLITTPQLARLLAPTASKCVGAVVGFPFGYQTIEAKIKELEDVIAYGVREVDVVVNHHAYVLGLRDLFENEVKAITTICREVGVTCKLIVEAPAYPAETVKEMVETVARHVPDYIKTSSGFGPRPTTPEDVLLIRSTLRKAGADGIGVKAAGGIRTTLQAVTMIAYGADIIGTSTPSAVLEGLDRVKLWARLLAEPAT